MANERGEVLLRWVGRPVPCMWIFDDGTQRRWRRPLSLSNQCVMGLDMFEVSAVRRFEKLVVA